MKRILTDNCLPDAGQLEADVVIIGSGAAGLYAALNLDPHLRCLIINKLGPDQSNSMDAQGGIAAVLKETTENDSVELHVQDTLAAGAGLCDETAVRILTSEAAENIERLLRLGISFDKENDHFLLTREGGHSARRILHAGGDATGYHLTSGLYRAVCCRDNLRILDKLCLVDLLTDEHGVCGLTLIDAQASVLRIRTRKIILASGGIGRLYRNSTSAAGLTGDGIAAAVRAGADVRHMAFVQFHPTALAYPDENGRYFLISEAVRGEGGILRNRNWEPFMQGQHPMADLAPRDIVTRAIIREMKKHNIPCVYLDITMQPRSFLKHRFPTIYETCMQRGIDIARDWIPVVPVQHYFMGGITTDYNGKTKVDGLYACGETACTGVHGANRLASNSLLECLVFGYRCALQINSGGFSARSNTLKLPDRKNSSSQSELDLEEILGEIRRQMTQNCGILRNGPDLETAKQCFHCFSEQLDGQILTGPKSVEAENAALVAGLVAEDALQRTVSVGAHYRTDCPNDSQERA